MKTLQQVYDKWEHEPELSYEQQALNTAKDWAVEVVNELKNNAGSAPEWSDFVKGYMDDERAKRAIEEYKLAVSDWAEKLTELPPTPEQNAITNADQTIHNIMAELEEAQKNDSEENKAIIQEILDRLEYCHALIHNNYKY